MKADSKNCFLIFCSCNLSQRVSFHASAEALSSVTRLGDLVEFGQLFKTCGTIGLPKSLAFLGNFCKGVKIFNFSSDIIFGQLL